MTAPVLSSALHASLFPHQRRHEFELVEWLPASRAPSFATTRASFRDVLLGASATKSADAAPQVAHKNPKPPALDLGLLCMPGLLRDASTASTPTDSLSPITEEADGNSPRSLSSSPSSPCLSEPSAPIFDDFNMDSDEADFGCAWPECTLPLPPIDTSLPPLDLASHTTEVDYEALEAEGLAAEEAAAAADACLAACASDVADVDSIPGDGYRVRHRALGDFPGSLSQHWFLRLNNRRSNSWRNVQFYNPSTKAGNQLGRLQQAAKPAPCLPARAAPVFRPTHHVSHPYEKAADRAEMGAPHREKPRRRNGKDREASQAARKATHAQRHSLAAPTRPAMQHASKAFRTVLADRAARKVHFMHAAAAAEDRAQMQKVARKHSRRRIRIPAAPVQQTHKPAPRKDISLHHTGCSGFSWFRENFFFKYQEMIEHALDNTGSRVAAVRLAPVGTEAISRFMARARALGCRDSDIALVYHGTRVGNMTSICRRGLLVPSAASGVTVANGSAHGVGIYTCRNASYPMSYVRGTSTMFVCAALTQGAVSAYSSCPDRESRGALVCGDIVVLFDNARVCPLFLMDFEPAPRSGYSPAARSQLPQRDEPPHVSRDLLRAMLRRAHTRLRNSHAEIFVRSVLRFIEQ